MYFLPKATEEIPAKFLDLRQNPHEFINSCHPSNEQEVLEVFLPTTPQTGNTQSHG